MSYLNQPLSKDYTSKRVECINNFKIIIKTLESTGCVINLNTGFDTFKREFLISGTNLVFIITVDMFDLKFYWFKLSKNKYGSMSFMDIDPALENDSDPYKAVRGHRFHSSPISGEEVFEDLSKEYKIKFAFLMDIFA